jgi:hypothetical protein
MKARVDKNNLKKFVRSNLFYKNLIKPYGKQIIFDQFFCEESKTNKRIQFCRKSIEKYGTINNAI